MKRNRPAVLAVVGVVAVESSWGWAQEKASENPSPGSAKVISLAESMEPFQTRFNADQQELRFLAVLSPS